MATSHIDDLLYEPISKPEPKPLYPFGVADLVRLQIGVITPFGAIVCSINEANGAVEVWSDNKGQYGQFWLMPGPHCYCFIEFVRKATAGEIGFATAQGMRLAA